MHEMSIAESIRSIVQDASVKQGFKRATEVHLEIGALAGIEIEALSFCIDVVFKGSVADGAKVILESVPGKGFCMACADTVQINALFDACPRCAGYQVQATGGTEMRVKNLLVEDN
jgi:hydrogenase nickel incorporation protein HypA/HybF